MDLIFNPEASSKFGAFKKAMFARTHQPLLGDSTNVCVKQCWYTCQASRTRLLYDNHTQVTKLSSEINCLRWGSALMKLVYDFIAEQCASRGDPPFEIPQMRFVHTALAITKNTSCDTYMVEEVIDEAEDDEFVKYIGNGSAKPCRHLQKDHAHRAEFLTFCQHVQYLKTKMLAFVGDFQGTSNSDLLYSSTSSQLSNFQATEVS